LDLTHVTPEAGLIYTYHLSWYFSAKKIGEPLYALNTVGIINPNGVEEVEKARFFWIGKGVTQLLIVSPRDGQGTIKGRFTLGPSLPEVPQRRVLLSTPSGYSSTLLFTNDGLYEFSFPVSAGLNRLTLQPLDRPAASSLPSGDKRPVLIGAQGLTFALSGKEG